MSSESDVQSEQGKQVYCTLVMTDSYVVGAVVLAHSLRDAGTKKELAVLITPDTMSEDAISCLRDVFDHVIPVERISSSATSNLTLLGRPDLRHTFTKIEIFRQTQFSKIVYIDADVVALRAPDELFDLPYSFAAAPDIGWPDAFNSGVLVLNPDLRRYNDLLKMATNGQSFDGADQGLLNEYFDKEGWHRISFTYNCTPNAEYQWVPAYQKYKNDITLVHFIGKQKPWSRGNWSQSGGSSVYRELLGKWWQVKNKHPGREFRRAGDGLPVSGWDPLRSAPPTGSRPEGADFPGQIHYEFAGPGQGGFRAPGALGCHSEPLPPALFPFEKEGRSAVVSRIWAHEYYAQPEPQPEEEVAPEPAVAQVETIVEAEAPLAVATRTWSPQLDEKWPETEAERAELSSPEDLEPKIRSQGVDYRGRPRFRPSTTSISPTTAKGKKGINRTQTPFVRDQDDDEWELSMPRHESPHSGDSFRPMVNAWDADPVVQRYMTVMMTRHATYHNPPAALGANMFEDPKSVRGFYPSYPSFKHAPQISRDIRDNFSVTSDTPSLTGNQAGPNPGDVVSDSAQDMTEAATSQDEMEGPYASLGRDAVDLSQELAARESRMRRKRAVRKDALAGSAAAVNEVAEDERDHTEHGEDDVGLPNRSLDMPKHQSTEEPTEPNVELTCPQCGFHGKKMAFA